jgi:hypothetical protein
MGVRDARRSSEPKDTAQLSDEVLMRRKHYNAIGIDQDLDATCHSRPPGHNGSRKCKVFKRKTSKRMRRVLREDMNAERE